MDPSERFTHVLLHRLQAANHPSTSANQNVTISMLKTSSLEWLPQFPRKLKYCRNKAKDWWIQKTFKTSTDARSVMKNRYWLQLNWSNYSHWRLNQIQMAAHSTSQHNSPWWSDQKLAKKDAGVGGQHGTLYRHAQSTASGAMSKGRVPNHSGTCRVLYNVPVHSWVNWDNGGQRTHI